MSDPLKKITEGKDIISSIRKTVSGFVGYFDRETRRDADKILREQIAKRYEEQWSRISSIQRQLIAAGELRLLDDIEEAAIKVRIFADRVRRAEYGYAGFFDVARVNQEELQRIYEFDQAMLDNVANFANAVDNLEASIGTDGLPAAIRHLVTLAQEALATFDRRKDVILEA